MGFGTLYTVLDLFVDVVNHFHRSKKKENKILFTQDFAAFLGMFSKFFLPRKVSKLEFLTNFPERDIFKAFLCDKNFMDDFAKN